MTFTIMNLRESEETTNFKEIVIEIASVLKLELADGDLLSNKSYRIYFIIILRTISTNNRLNLPYYHQ
jgi:hypothetical protein